MRQSVRCPHFSCCFSPKRDNSLLPPAIAPQPRIKSYPTFQSPFNILFHTPAPDIWRSKDTGSSSTCAELLRLGTRVLVPPAIRVNKKETLMESKLQPPFHMQGTAGYARAEVYPDCKGKPVRNLRSISSVSNQEL